MKKNTIDDCLLIKIPKIDNDSGNLMVVDNEDVTGYGVKRVYYLYDIPGGSERGGHAHKEQIETLFAVMGSFDVILDDGKDKKTINLNRADIGLKIVPGIWRELNNFTSGAICLVLASEYYDEEDYVRDYSEFLKVR
jgi:dTDP-4-dehydrorhamnose 3,5-epimerase-like enzyme